jgi:hypothetical protein
MPFDENGKTGTRNTEDLKEYWWSYGKTKLIYLESGVPENFSRRYIEIIEEYLGE